MQQMKDQNYNYQKQKPRRKGAMFNPEDDFYVEETLCVAMSIDTDSNIILTENDEDSDEEEHIK